ncbi:hypothetical protein KI387_003762, partial [Taxus chinensis]
TFWKTRTGPPPCIGRRLQDRRPDQGGGHETAALKGGGFVTEEKGQGKRGKRGKTKGTQGLSGACG